MHSSRMRTGRSLTVFRSLLSWGGYLNSRPPPKKLEGTPQKIGGTPQTRLSLPPEKLEEPLWDQTLPHDQTPPGPDTPCEQNHTRL